MRKLLHARTVVDFAHKVVVFNTADRPRDGAVSASPLSLLHQRTGNCRANHCSFQYPPGGREGAILHLTA
jgi:hypothetical protein